MVGCRQTVFFGPLARKLSFILVGPFFFGSKGQKSTRLQFAVKCCFLTLPISPPQLPAISLSAKEAILRALFPSTPDQELRALLAYTSALETASVVWTSRLFMKVLRPPSSVPRLSFLFFSTVNCTFQIPRFSFFLFFSQSTQHQCGMCRVLAGCLATLPFKTVDS